MEIQPTVFIGSTVESLPVVEALAENLEREVTVIPWTGDVFKPGDETHHALVEATESCDFAVLVLGADAVLHQRGEVYAAPGDNVIYELGLFTAKLGASRTFYVYDSGRDVKRPSDVIGITGLAYKIRNRASVSAADLTTAAGKIKRRIRELGPLRRGAARPKVYWCGPHTRRERNHEAASLLSGRGISVLVPDDLVQAEMGGNVADRPGEVRRICVDALREADYVVVDVDNYGLDSAWEIGYAEAIHKPVFGLSRNESGFDERRSIYRRRYDDNFMHGWDQLIATDDLAELAEMCAGKVVHVCGAFENEHALKELGNSVVAQAAERVIFPKDLLDLGARFPRDYSWRTRQEAIRLLARSDIILTMLPRYGMDTSWQLGHAAGLGKQIVGWLWEDRLRDVSEELLFDHWMHGWKQKTRLSDINTLAALINGLHHYP